MALIKIIKQIDTIHIYKIPMDVLELSPPLNNEIKYITGGFYKTGLYMMAAFYQSDEKGNIINPKPVLLEEGVNNYLDIFAKLGYTLL